MRTNESTAVRMGGWTLTLIFMITGCGGSGRSPEALRVMTHNVYYGFDVGPLLAASSPEEIPVLAAQAFQQLVSTDFAERAEAIATEIAAKKPHLVGLQEVALIRLQSPGDSVVGGTVLADAVLFDHLEILLGALASRGLDYRVAGKVQNVDVELPMVTGSDPLTFDDIRLTDFDVVLARGDVAVSNVTAQNFQSTLFVPSLGLEVLRGFVAVDAAIPGTGSIRFVNTHLEDTPFPEVQLAQAGELAAALSTESKPVVLVGDFNSSAPDGGVCPFFASQGFSDAWLRNRRTDQGAGLTWGHDPDLRNPNDQFTVRIDLVLVRHPGFEVEVSAEVWGDSLADRTPSGLWPSDHAAVVAELQVRRGR